MLRKQNRWYIQDSPFDIVLTPYPETKTPAGGKVRIPGTPRSPQTVRLVPLDRQRTTARNFLSVVGAGGSGTQTDVVFEIIGDVDLLVEKYDRFPGPDGTTYEITEVSPLGSAPYLRRAFARGSPGRGV
jgi:hypothetical protein